MIHWPAAASGKDITEWLSQHCRAHHMHRDRSYIFEDQGDAVNFTLRWL